jgi:hypothetical protein
VMLDRIDNYRTTLQGHSGPLMPFIEWRHSRSQCRGSQRYPRSLSLF